MGGILELLGIFIAISSPIWIIMLIKHRTRVAELQATHGETISTQEVAELKRLVTVLTERMAVLETIVTDKGYELQEKFKHL